MSRPVILLTNDDGIESHGLWAAADSLAPLGEVVVIAPRRQWSGSGRSMPAEMPGTVRPWNREEGGVVRAGHAVDGSPAQAVLIGILELLPEPPALVVSGINAGENLGSSITISGTVGAALEGAAAGVPAMAVSLEMAVEFHREYERSVDYSAAGHFCRQFAGALLGGLLPWGDAAAIKVDVPCDATPQTPWVVTRVSAHRYFLSQKPVRRTLEEPAVLPYSRVVPEAVEPESDVEAVARRRIVSVSPLSLDLSARVNRDEFRRLLEHRMGPVDGSTGGSSTGNPNS